MFMMQVQLHNSGIVVVLIVKGSLCHHHTFKNLSRLYFIDFKIDLGSEGGMMDVIS